MPIMLLSKKNRVLYLPRVIFAGRFQIAAQKLICIFGGSYFSESDIEIVFDPQIQSLDLGRLIFWILGLCTPISPCV